MRAIWRKKLPAEIRKKAGIEKAAGLLSSDKKLSYERAAGLLEAAVRNAEGCALSFDNIKAKFEEMLDALGWPFGPCSARAR